jgi:hypothetical protein
MVRIIFLSISRLLLCCSPLDFTIKGHFFSKQPRWGRIIFLGISRLLLLVSRRVSLTNICQDWKVFLVWPQYLYFQRAVYSLSWESSFVHINKTFLLQIQLQNFKLKLNKCEHKWQESIYTWQHSGRKKNDTKLVIRQGFVISPLSRWHLSSQLADLQLHYLGHTPKPKGVEVRHACSQVSEWADSKHFKELACPCPCLAIWYTMAAEVTVFPVPGGPWIKLIGFWRTFFTARTC